MSDATEQTTIKNRMKKSVGNSHVELAVPLAVQAVAKGVRTIFVGFPTPSTVVCPSPFHASGTNTSTTVMDPAATVVTPTGNLTGNLLAQPDPPFTWTYEFTDPLPVGVPLALVVRGTTAGGTIEEVVVPFQAQ
ncbi:MAG TPA: hypothetical protein VEL76_00230 [Gemmataceae bacterium]|nr:hypothetical protein [Gemmataceae bacterium]